MKKHYKKSQPIIKNLDLIRFTQDPLAQANSFISEPQNTTIITQSFNNLTHPKQKHDSWQMRVALTELQEDLKSVQNQIVHKKLKKYKPTNSSFTMFYGQKISMRRRQNHPKQSANITNLPTINQRSKYSQNKIDEHSIQKYKSPKQVQYLKKISKIKQMGDQIREQSQQLESKTDNAEKYMQKKYLKLKEKSDQIVTGTRVYHLEQQINNSYKRQILEMWMRADTRKF